MAGAQSAWGIDVGVSSLKALKLRRDGDRVTVEAFEVLEHDKFLTEPDVDRDALTRSTLQKFMNKYGAKRDVVFIGVPGSTTFARFVKLPPVETKKIPEIVKFEAIQQIPFPLEQVNWDYHTFQAPDSPDVEVGIFAMKKELVAQIMSNFRAADMNVQGVQMSPLAVYNAAAFDGMTEDKGTIIIDMGAEHTDLVIMDQGRVWLRSINIGGNHFTDALAKSFKQQFMKAESLKKTAATSKYQKQIYQAMRPIFADLVAEIQRSLGAYNSTHRDSRLERIVCMGNPFKLPNLQKYLQQELKMEVVRLENYKQANVEKAAAFSENILSMSAAYGLAIQALGLAQINTNLLPMEIARQMMWKKKQPWFIGSAAVLALGAVAMGGQYWINQSNFENGHSEQKADNRTRFDNANRLKGEWNAVASNYDAARKALDDQFKLITPRKVWPMIRTDILASLPQAQNPRGATVVITDLNAEYNAHLTELGALTSATPAGGGAATPAPALQPGAATVLDETAATQPVTGQIGDSNHGFVITIMGYAPPTRERNDYNVLAFQNLLAQRAPSTNTAKPYYFEKETMTYQGHPVLAPATAGGAFGAFGGGGGGSTTAQTGDRPWGNNKGPYWELFITDLTGVKAPTTAPGGMLPGGMMAPPGGMPSGLPGAQDVAVVGDILPLDLVATRMSSPPQPRPMTGMFTFTMKFKVHVRTQIPWE
jgi:type IV pilus assembly protein PilM